MAVWPATLPQKPLRNGFSEALQANAIGFQPEVGPPKLRRRGTAAATQIQVMFNMTANQWATLLVFFRDTLAEVSSFQGPAVYGFSGNFMFAAPPSRTALGPDLYSVPLSLLKLA